MLLNTTFNENSQFLSPWACWSRVGEFAHVSFECRSTTASRTSETMREQGRDSSQQMTTGPTEKRRGRKRGRRRRKYSHAPEINNLPKFGSLREGEYELMTSQHSVRCIRTLANNIRFTGDILSIFTALNPMHLITCVPH